MNELYRTFSQRVLCPCHGMLQVVSLKGGVAESVDGFTWKLYVADESIVSHTGLSEVRYGEWNPQTGSSRSKIRGTCASNLIEETGEQLISALEECADQVPFPPLDWFEYWLLDGENGMPLALLESRTEIPQVIEVETHHWHPGAAAKNRFTSDFGDADSLMSMIQQQAGRRPSGIWVKRNPSGNGITLNGEELNSQQFPELFLSTAWPDRDQSHLAEDFLAWQAPWLLQIHNLSQATRRRLERAAWQRPFETSRVFRLFPQVIDERGLIATRVKARMLRDSSRTNGPAEPFYPFFNE